MAQGAPRARRGSWFGAFGADVARNRRRYGGYIVHIGIVVTIVGIAASRTFLSEGNFELRPGQQASGRRLHVHGAGVRSQARTPTR